MKSAVESLSKKTDEWIWRRGEAYADGNKVAIAESGEEEIRAIARGTKQYLVELKFSGGEISQQCNCPFANQDSAYSPICKHMVAAAIVWDKARGLGRFRKKRSRQDYTRIISAKNLGQLALADFCQRCFWLERKLGKPPAVFPGIFSTFDSLTKRSVKRSFAEKGLCPRWLFLENIRRPVKAPRISVPMPECGDWILTGDPDEIFELEDGSYHIVDYKVAKFTGRQDDLLPMYEVQLNAYASALPVYNIQPISRLSLVYCEPKEDLDSDDDFCLSFKIRTLEIDIQPQVVPKLLKRAREILELKNPPEPRPGCKDICRWAERARG